MSPDQIEGTETWKECGAARHRPLRVHIQVEIILQAVIVTRCNADSSHCVSELFDNISAQRSRRPHIVPIGTAI